MTQKDGPPGLAVRIEAAERLGSVLRGASFMPFSGAEIADARDRAFANRLVTTALRRHGHLDHIIADRLSRGLPARSGRFEAVLRLALTELLFMPEQAAHSAVFLAAESLKLDRRARHLVKLMNGVLRGVQRAPDAFGALPDDALFPAWLAARWRRIYGSGALPQFAKSLVEGAPLDLTLAEDDPALADALKAHRVHADTYRVSERDRPVGALPGYESGRFWVQDAASALPARLFGLETGARILDLCAAPGGKTAQLIKYGYNVTALDVDAARMQRVRENLDRLGMQAETVVADALGYTSDTLFDGVLVDAPCSATGTFRRHPEVIWHRREADIGERAGLQRRLVAQAAGCVRPGGVLIYCSCSLEPEEGEAQAAWIAANLPDLAPHPITAGEMGELAAAIDAHGLLRVHPGLAAPGEMGGTMDGFLVARFRRGQVQID